ncbi:MAG: Fis family transcriptional regulator [Gammaproteobacteria bacterium]
MKNIHKGSTVESFLAEENVLDDAEAIAIKRVIAFELKLAMQKQHISKSKMATKLQTSRSSLERLLDPNNTSVTLHTLLKTAHILGRKLHLSFA